MELNKIHSILVSILDKVDKIESVVDELNNKVDNMEKQIQVAQTTHQQPQTQVAVLTSISTTEEKIKFLNQQTNAETQEDFLGAIKSRLLITKSGVLGILNQTITIYEYVADVIYEFNNTSSCEYLYGFSGSKCTLYYWNHAKKTWTKFSKTHLHEIFMEVQKRIIIKYNELMNEDDSLKKGCVDNGDLIFADDFEKRHGDFKKALISRFT